MSNGNEHAFPHLVLDGGRVELSGGMSKREAFAMAAMQGILAGGMTLNAAEIADFSVIHADALLAELAKEAK